MLSIGIRMELISNAHLVVVNNSGGEFSDACRILPEVLIVDKV